MKPVRGPRLLVGMSHMGRKNPAANDRMPATHAPRKRPSIPERNSVCEACWDSGEFVLGESFTKKIKQVAGHYHNQGVPWATCAAAFTPGKRLAVRRFMLKSDAPERR